MAQARAARRAGAGARARIAAALTLATVSMLVACGTPSDEARTASRGGWHGTEPQPVPERPEFTLTDTSGRAFDFHDRTAGRPTLVYFGYTNCPDECPTAMADIAAALRQTDEELRERVQVVLVTTDPERDTPERLRRWLDKFGEDFIGLTGSQRAIDAAQQAVGFQPATKAGPIPTLPGQPDQHEHKPGTAPHTHDGPLGYGVNHANVIFAYSADDRLPVVYTAGVTASDIAADLPALAAKSRS